MPTKPKKPCAYPGCPRLTYGRYCEKHQKERNAQYEKYERDRVATKRRYGKNWKLIRDAYVKKHPFCELCFQKGVLAPVEEVHHILPLAEGGTNDRDNLISLCKSCHSRIHAKRGDRWHGGKEYCYGKKEHDDQRPENDPLQHGAIWFLHYGILY
jgi:5-methylcytosine-specific restriction protein A